MSGNLNVAMTLRLVDQVSGPVQGIVAELNKLQSISNALDTDKGISRAGGWQAETSAIQGVVSELGQLGGATAASAEAATAASNTSIARYNQQLRSVADIVAQVTTLRTVTAEAGIPIDTAIGKLNQEKSTIEGVTAAMRQLGTASAEAAESGRRPGDAPNWGERPDWSQYWANKGRPEGWTKASDHFEAQAKAGEGQEHPPTIADGGGGLISGMVGFGEMTTGYRVLRNSYDQSATAQSMNAAMDAAGYSAGEIGKINVAADQFSREAKIFSRNSVVGMLKDARSILGSTDHAIEAMPTILNLATIAEAKHPGQGETGVASLLSGMESSGSTNSIEEFNRRANTIAKVQNVYGATIDYAQWGQFFNQAGSAGPRLSEQFIGEDLPHLLQEMEGAKAGTMIRSLMRGTADMRMDKSARDLLGDYGLLDQSKVDDKGHLLPSAFLHADVMQSNPYEYAQRYLKPAFAARNLSDTEEEQVLNRMFSNSNTARAMAIFMRQSNIIDKDAAQVRAARGIEAAPLLAASDPRLTATSIGAQFQNLERQAGAPLMPTITRLESAIASGIGSINDVLSRVPGASTAVVGAGSLGIGALGLKTAQYGFSRVAGMFGSGSGAGAGAGGVAEGAVGAGGMTEGTLAAAGTTIGVAGAAAIAAGAAAMGGTVYGLSHIGPRPGQRGRVEPPSINESAMPGHFTYGRGGVRDWIPDQPGIAAAAPAPLGPSLTTAALQAMLAPLASVVTQSVAAAGAAREARATAVPTAAPPQSVTNNNQRTDNITVNAPVTVNATVNNTTPGAIAGAVAGGIHRAVGYGRVALGHQGSTGALHDGHETR